jgi:hypothetical protein
MFNAISSHLYAGIRLLVTLALLSLLLSLLSEFTEETGDNNRREDIKDQVIKWGYLKGTIAKLYVPWYIFPISSSGDAVVSQ